MLIGEQQVEPGVMPEEKWVQQGLESVCAEDFRGGL